MRMIKNILILVMVFLMSINSFSVAVSDNDGSSFITKPEFEALKGDFLNKINEYNVRIDSKIDEAIDSYLKGVNASFKDDRKLIYGDWEKVTSLNYVFDNQYELIDLNVTYNLCQNAYLNNSGWKQCTWGFGNVKYERPTTTYQKRMLCDAGNEKDVVPESVVWLGLALDYREKITASRTILSYAEHADNAGEKYSNRVWFNAYGSCYLYFCNYATFIPGYYENLGVSVKDFWLPQIYLYNNGSSYYTYYLVQYENYAGSCETEINLNSVLGKSVDYEHIIMWKDENNFMLSDVDWRRHLTANPILTRGKYSEKNEPDLTKISYWAGLETNETSSSTLSNGGSIEPFSDCYISDYTNKNNDTNKMISIGLIDNNYSASDIKQVGAITEVVVDSNKYNTEITNLVNGFTCFAANKGDEIVWEPKFINLYKDGIAADFEVNVELATKPFENQNSLSAGATILKSEGQVEDYLTTTDKKCKFKFIMPEGGLVYCKWWPADNSIVDSSKWSIDLDVKNCNVYHRKPIS